MWNNLENAAADVISMLRESIQNLISDVEDVIDMMRQKVNSILPKHVKEPEPDDKGPEPESN